MFSIYCSSHFFLYFFFFFFNDTATTEIYTLSLHDALPILANRGSASVAGRLSGGTTPHASALPDRKSTRLNSSHSQISYAVFCLKKKKKKKNKNKKENKKNKTSRHHNNNSVLDEILRDYQI